MIFALYSSIGQFGQNPKAAKEVLGKLNVKLKKLKTNVIRGKFSIYQVNVNWSRGVMTLMENFYRQTRKSLKSLLRTLMPMPPK